jgi:hypothetical protein
VVGRSMHNLCLGMGQGKDLPHPAIYRRGLEAR